MSKRPQRNRPLLFWAVVLALVVLVVWLVYASIGGPDDDIQYELGEEAIEEPVGASATDRP